MEIGETISLQLDLEQSRMFWSNMQAVSTNMVSMTENVLASVKDICITTVSDHEDVPNEVTSLEKKCHEILRVIQQQTRDWLQHMEEVQQTKDMETPEAFNTVEQQECPSTAELEEMEVLIEALTQSCPPQLGRAWQHQSRIRPALQQLCERVSVAVEESKLHQAERDQALEDSTKMQQDLERAEASLQDAMAQIRDLNTQITILSTEMVALRQELTEVEQESAQLQKCNTELSATITSTMASYAFLEQALGNETKKLVLHTSMAQEAREKASGLEQALEASQCRVQELTESLAEMENQAMAQAAQQGPLQTLEAEIARLNELNEFLDLETKVAQEQAVQSSEMLCRQLQSLRERNLECEDLKDALSRIREERDSFGEQLNREQTLVLELSEQMSQVTDTTKTLYQRIFMLTTVLELALNDKTQAPESSAEEQSTSITSPGEEKQDLSSKTIRDAGVKNVHINGLGSTSSAFSRVAATTDNKEEDTIAAATDLTDMFTKFQTIFNQYERHRDAELDQLRKAKEELEEQLRDDSHRHQQEEQKLQEQLHEVDKNSAAKLKDQDQKSLTKWSTDINNFMEKNHKLKLENIELRKKGAEWKQLLQQSEVEGQILKEEIAQAAHQSDSTTKAMDERILLSKQVEKLKLNLAEAEESKSKIMEKAKRHESVHKINQSKLVRELHLLDSMMETVRKTLASMPHVVNNCVELQKLMEYLG
ncbi:sperm-associated antigen 5 isoform X2 [Engraulis encrasicolus]|uniref:sperm-associated antigen 5 isoform X2 n=1 Tax=Engraulis encrasicolus TaxID=184585 RepID=UPI002FD4F3E8